MAARGCAFRTGTTRRRHPGLGRERSSRSASVSHEKAPRRVAASPAKRRAGWPLGRASKQGTLADRRVWCLSSLGEDASIPGTPRVSGHARGPSTRPRQTLDQRRSRDPSADDSGEASRPASRPPSWSLNGTPMSLTIVLLKLFFERWRTMSDRIRSASARPRSGPRSAARRLLPPFSGSDKAVSNTQDSLRHHALVKRPVSSASPRRSPVQRAAVVRDRVWGPPSAVPWQTGFFGWCRQSRSGR
jgi:hypothetical protein